ncbi:hypothetical protein [Bacillus sp. AK128]
MKKKWYLIIVVVIIVFLSIKYFNDHREKGLDDVISYDISNFESLSFNEGTERFEWKTDKKEHAEEFKDFLNQYRVKRMKDSEWNSDVSQEEGFIVNIYSKGKQIPITASIYEKRVHFFNEGNYYKVINEQIDIEWVKNYITEHSH